jgi:hypothetical protein
VTPSEISKTRSGCALRPDRPLSEADPAGTVLIVDARGIVASVNIHESPRKGMSSGLRRPF